MTHNSHLTKHTTYVRLTFVVSLMDTEFQVSIAVSIAV